MIQHGYYSNHDGTDRYLFINFQVNTYATYGFIIGAGGKYIELRYTNNGTTSVIWRIS